MTKREGVIAVSLMVMMYVAAFLGGYRSARAKLDVMLEQGCRMRCQMVIPPPASKEVPTPPGYKGPSSRT